MVYSTTESLSLESSSSALPRPWCQRPSLACEHVPVLALLSGEYFLLEIYLGFEDSFRLFVASFTRG